MNNDSQLAFDLDELVREDLRANPPEWQGAPLHFTTDYFSPGELQAAFEHWQLLNGRFGSIPHSRMWHTGYGWLNGGTEYGDHRLVMFSADLRPEPKCEGPGDLMYLAVCEPCEWHQVSDSEIDSVEGWHNHAIPNWRELPVVPAQIRVRDGGGFTKLGRKWIAAHYPAEMQVSGAPIITERARYATRHVAEYSPRGGYDLSSTALDRPLPEPSTEAPAANLKSDAPVHTPRHRVSAVPEHAVLFRPSGVQLGAHGK